MKKVLVISLVLVLALGITGCSWFDPKVPVVCGDEVIKVKVDDVSAYKEACGITPAETEVSTDTNQDCNSNCDVVTPAAPPAVVEEAPEVNFVATKCSYDYSFMPEGYDQFGVPKADKGVFDFTGPVSGPAIVQLDSLTIVSVYPGEVFNVSDKTDRIWKYSGDLDCLIAQYVFFPNKNITRITAQ